MSEDMKGFSGIDTEDLTRIRMTGLQTDSLEGRSGSFLQVDEHIHHASTDAEGIEILPIAEALVKYDWLEEYYWKAVPRDKDEITQYVAAREPKGYVIIARRGSKTTFPLQTCLFLASEEIQYVHNIIIAEEGAELHLIAGCASSAKIKDGKHYGVTEFYIKKDAKVTMTMIHTWGESIEVYPRSVSIIEERGVFISNYVCMVPAKVVQMYPTAELRGEGSVARFSSIMLATPGSYLDTGSRAILSAKGASAELITRAITTGGTIISRGHILGSVKDTKGHIECRALILKDGLIHAIPEIEGRVVDCELSHEAAVGRIARDEIEYLMARGLSEDEATATIIRGFLDVKISGLPESLQKQIDAAIDAAEKGF